MIATAKIRGQESFLLSTSTVELAITKLGGMLAPVTFFPGSTAPIQPYHIAPWAEETVAADTAPMLRALRGDWFCSAFGENREPHAGQHLPPHGETANGTWQYIDTSQGEEGAWLRLGTDLPLQGGHCESTTALIAGHSVIYQRHALSGLTSPISLGHHATLEFATTGVLSFSRTIYARTALHAIDGPGSEHYSRLQPNTAIHDLTAVPLSSEPVEGSKGEGTTTDLTRYPARRGFDDIAIVCADPSLDFAWVSVTFPEQGYAWFALRDPRQLASTLLWFSNGGRKFPPWNGRHINVMGIEDITAFFHVGLATSCRANALTERGIPTCLEPENGRLSIPYIQGVARTPQDFDRVALIEPVAQNKLLLIAESGAIAEVTCQCDFLRTGKLRQLNF